MADGVWKGVYPKVFGHFKQLSLNKFFDPSTPSMRKVDNGAKNGGERKQGQKLWPLMSLPEKPHKHRLTGTPKARANIIAFHPGQDQFVVPRL